MHICMLLPCSLFIANSNVLYVSKYFILTPTAHNKLQERLEAMLKKHLIQFSKEFHLIALETVCGEKKDSKVRRLIATMGKIKHSLSFLYL